GEQCAVVGRSWRLPPLGAVFLNAFHARIQTFDDTHDTGPFHPGCAALSAALACSEVAGLTGRRFLTAVLAGYETGTRVAAAVSPSHYDRGFQSTGTCNSFAAAAAAGHAMGFDGDALLECLGLAGQSASGLRQFQVDGSMIDTSFAGARAALVGVVSAQMRAAGLPGAQGVLDGRWGFCNVTADDADLERLSSGLGERFEFAATALKPYPSCRFTHGPVEELLRLRVEHGIAAADVEEVVIFTFRHSIEVSDRPIVISTADAILSHQYAAALALARGHVDLPAIADHAALDAVVSGLMRRIMVVHDEDLERLYPEHWPHRVTIRLRDGRSLAASSTDPPGGRGRRLSRAVVKEKFLANAESLLGREAAEQTIEAVDDLPQAPNLERLVRNLSGISEGQAWALPPSAATPRWAS
ncbi:MAG: MmgE/PrpD family protein, partial [Geminicoccales bacterium]